MANTELEDNIDLALQKARISNDYADTILGNKPLDENEGVSINLDVASSAKFKVDGSTFVIDSALPYVELEYIQSTGTQYIDTGILHTSDYKFIFEYKLVALTSQDTKFFGTDISPFVHVGTFGNKLRYELTENKTTQQVQDLYKHTVEIGKDLIVDDILLQTNATFAYNNNCNIFAVKKASGVVGDYANIKLYSFKAYNSVDDLILNLIPVKNIYTYEVCLYDKVTKQFFTNQGTGSFIAGPEIS